MSPPGIQQGDLTREINGSYTSLSYNTDSQSERDLASSTIEEYEGPQSADHHIPHQIISYKQSEHYSEDQELDITLDYDSLLKKPTPNAQKATEDIFTKSSESPLEPEVEDNRMPTLQHKFHTIPSLMKSIAGSRQKLPRVPTDVISGVKNKSKNSFELKKHPPKTYEKSSSNSARSSSSSDDFSDILAAASNAAKRRKVNVRQTSTFFDTNTNHSVGSFTKRDISESDTRSEGNFLSSESDESFSKGSNLEFISSLNSPSPQKEPKRIGRKTVSSRTSNMEYRNDSMILQPSDFGVTTSQEDIIEFSDSGMNGTSLMVAKDLEDPLQETNADVNPGSSRKDSEGEPETPEWLKRMSLSLGFTPPKMSRLLRK